MKVNPVQMSSVNIHSQEKIKSAKTELKESNAVSTSITDKLANKRVDLGSPDIFGGGGVGLGWSFQMKETNPMELIRSGKYIEALKMMQSDPNQSEGSQLPGSVPLHKIIAQQRTEAQQSAQSVNFLV